MFPVNNVLIHLHTFLNKRQYVLRVFRHHIMDSYDMCSRVLSCGRLFATLWTVARQAPLSMGFSRQEYWSGLPLPSPEGGRGNPF